jgi:adenine-specific DNA-methyltransferase
LSSKIQIPETEGIKYAGSKLKILPYLFEAIDGLKIDTVLDGFSGSTRVSQAFSKLGYQITSNDISEWSEIFAKCFLLNTRNPTHYQPIINHLNHVKPIDGWFTQYYGGTVESPEKRPFQVKNTQKLDAIRQEIDKMQLDDIEKSVALASLILAMDSVDNTLGHYAAYLKNWSKRSYKEIELKLPKLYLNEQENQVIKGDIFDTIKKNEYDLAYFDPPYGSNNEKMPPSRVRYASYYHIWTSVIKNDHPAIFGKVNRREDSRDHASPSIFEEFRKDAKGNFFAMEAIRKLIQETNSRYILLSYSSGGRATKQELKDILSSSGKLLKAIEIDYKKNVMGAMRWTNEWVNSDKKYHEYLFLMEKL